MRRILLQHNFYRFVFLSVCQKCTSLIFLFIILGIVVYIIVAVRPVVAAHMKMYIGIQTHVVSECSNVWSCAGSLCAVISYLLRVFTYIWNSTAEPPFITLIGQLSYSGVLQLCKYNSVTRLTRWDKWWVIVRLHFKSVSRERGP